ncbi:MAG: hypothetical protein SV253_09455 [Halobacteria archaeon]|nr:hypothetical protein [Halobacteria archaeon]
MEKRRVINILAIILVLSAVFYVSLVFFTESDVVTRKDGNLETKGDVLAVKIVALASFLVVATVGLYVLFEIMTYSNPNRRIRRQTRRYVSWKLNHDFASPPSIQMSSVEKEEETEEDDIEFRRW